MLDTKKLKLQDLTNILKDPAFKTNKNRSRLSKIYTSLFLIISDMLSTGISFLLAMLSQYFILDYSMNDVFANSMNIFLLTLPIFNLFYYFGGLYPSYGKDQVTEFKAIIISSTIILSILGAVAAIALKPASIHPYIFLITAWFIINCITLPLRTLTKTLLSKKDWWGIPIMIIGAGRTGHKVTNTLNKQKLLGLKPVVIIDDDVDKWGYIEEVPVVGGLNIIPKISKKLNIKHAIIAMPKVPSADQLNIIRKNSAYFSNLTIIPDMFNSGIWTSTQDLGGVLGLEVQTKLLKRSSQIKKRIFDLVLTSILIVLTSPIQIIVAVLIKLDSKGNILFCQQRCGVSKKDFGMYKFRSMQIDAEDRLKEVLHNNKKLQEDFDKFHKIDNDPRLTRVGKFIRKYSLDELPQFFNVIKGDMSLIGPRAYLAWEVEKIKPTHPIFQVKPGVSGLWQVTDRSSTFEERLRIEEYYVRNWSFSLDCILVGKTIAAIIKGTGN